MEVEDSYDIEILIKPSTLIKTANNCVKVESQDPTTSANGNASNITFTSYLMDSDAKFNWQADHKALMDRAKFLLFNKIMSDITFIVGKEREPIPAHKFVLSISSAVFEAMFYSLLATQSCEIEIPDIEPIAFRSLLRFLYTDEVTIDPDTVMITLYSAKKYSVAALEEHCISFLESSLNCDNAFLLLSQARLFDVKSLINKSLEMIDRSTQTCIASDCFLDIDNETLEMLLLRDTLRIRELKLYEAVMRWAKAECLRHNLVVSPENQRAVLKNCINKIRYPLMTSQEFASGPAQDGLLMDRQKVQLFLYFNLNPKPVTEFCKKQRCCMAGREAICNRFLQVDHRWGYSGTSDRIRFQVDQRIFIAGFGLYGSLTGPYEYDVDIEIIYIATSTQIASNKTKFISDGTDRTFRVMFKEPVEILPFSSYYAVATLKGCDSYYGTKGLRKVMISYKNDCNPINITFNFSCVNGSNNGTSIEDGQIPEIIFYA